MAETFQLIVFLSFVTDALATRGVSPSRLLEAQICLESVVQVTIQDES